MFGPKATSQAVADQVRDTASAAADTARRTAMEGSARAAEAVTDIAERAAELAGVAAERALDAAREAQRAATPVIRTAASRSAEALSEAAERAAVALADTAGRLSDAAAEQAAAATATRTKAAEARRPKRRLRWVLIGAGIVAAGAAAYLSPLGDAIRDRISGRSDDVDEDEPITLPPTTADEFEQGGDGVPTAKPGIAEEVASEDGVLSASQTQGDADA